MKKNKFNPFFLTILLIALISLAFLFFVYRSSYLLVLDKKLLSQSTEIQKAFKNYDIVNCEFGFYNTKYAFVSFQHYEYPDDNSELKFWRVDFYDLKRDSIISTNWSVDHIGGSNVENITYSELLSMVKNDCSQFQTSSNGLNENGIFWGYRRVDKDAGVVFQKESKANNIRELFSRYTEEEAVVLKKVFGDWESLNDDEIIEYDKNFEEKRSALLNEQRDRIEDILWAETERYIEAQKLEMENNAKRFN